MNLLQHTVGLLGVKAARPNAILVHLLYFDSQHTIAVLVAEQQSTRPACKRCGAIAVLALHATSSQAVLHQP